jgi:predicted nucleic acid-binding protein
MRPPRVYVDTSVFGGSQDVEFDTDSQRFFDRVRAGDFEVLVSRMVLEELASAPSHVQGVLRTLPPDRFVVLERTAETLRLADAYIDAGVLTASKRTDALHVAAATVARADLILSWNFRHMVNYDRIRGFSAVNLMQGYHPVDIRSPQELAYGREDEDV